MLYPSAVDAILRRRAKGDVALGELVDVAGYQIKAGEDPSPAERFIGLEHVERHTGRVVGSLGVDHLTGPKTLFAPGDVLYPRLRPYLNKAWVTQSDGLCSVDQYVLRPPGGTDAELLAHALRGRSVLLAAIGFTSSLQLPRIRKADLLSIRVPVIPTGQQSDAKAELAQARDQVIRLFDLRQEASRLCRALHESSLNLAFSNRY